MPNTESDRVPFITDRNKIPEAERGNYDLIYETRGDITKPFQPLLNSPDLAGRVAHLGTYIRYESTLPGDVRELAIIATGREFDAAYEWAVHEPIARDEGVSEEIIEVVASRGPLDDLPEEAALIIRFVRELIREHKIADDTFTDAKARFGDQGVTELTGTVAFYSMMACLLNGLEVTPDDRTLPSF